MIGECKSRYHDWTASFCPRNVRSLTSMLSRWLLFPTGCGAIVPSCKCNKTSSVVVSRGGSDALRTCHRGTACFYISPYTIHQTYTYHTPHIPSQTHTPYTKYTIPWWKCFTTYPAITITGVCVCVPGGRPVYDFTSTAIYFVSLSLLMIPYLQSQTSKILLLLPFVLRPLTISILLTTLNHMQSSL